MTYHKYVQTKLARNEASGFDARQETARRAAVAGACGDVRTQRKIEARIRAWKKRRAR